MGLIPARRPGWLLEGRGDPSPRGMAAQSRSDARWTKPGLQALWHRSARNGGAIFLSRTRMAKQRRLDDWGFPRWRAYGKGRDAASIRLCDRDGCSEVGDLPAPKAPHSRDRWYFCQAHAAEY